MKYLIDTDWVIELLKGKRDTITALHHNLILLTNNRSHFTRILGLTLISSS
jgi:predicted nucleic acid-binding protein